MSFLVSNTDLSFLELNTVVYLQANSIMFDDYYADKFGNEPFKNSPGTNHKDQFVYRAVVIKVPTMYPVGAKRKLKFYQFQIDELDEECEWEMSTNDIYLEAKIHQNVSSKMFIVTKKHLDSIGRVIKQYGTLDASPSTSKDYLPTAVEMLPDENANKVEAPKSTSKDNLPTAVEILPDENANKVDDESQTQLSEDESQTQWLDAQFDSDQLLAGTFDMSPASSTRSAARKLGLVKSKPSQEYDKSISTTETQNLMDGYDTEAANSGYALSREEFINLNDRKTDRHTMIEMAYWDADGRKWSHNPAIKPTKHPDPTVKLTVEDHALWKQLYTNPLEKFRPKNKSKPKSFPANRGNFTGLFEYCGCMRTSCKGNVVSSSHCCRFCKKSMHGFCMVGENLATFGVCRSCYFTVLHTGNTQQSTTATVINPSINKNTKRPINVLPAPSVLLPTVRNAITTVRPFYASAIHTANATR